MSKLLKVTRWRSIIDLLPSKPVYRLWSVLHEQMCDPESKPNSKSVENPTEDGVELGVIMTDLSGL
jgi:hypothetical protein